MDKKVPDLSILVSKTNNGSIVAPAGFGKTEEIAKASSLSKGRQLILTHTHAGVDSLKRRMVRLRVRPESYQVETIASWCLKYVSSFPSTTAFNPEGKNQKGYWNTIYKKCKTIVDSGVLDRIITASYVGLYVDEYQDCSITQHEIIKSLSRLMNTCVFGDPLQAIFSFGGQVSVDWDKNVYPAFPLIETLKTPWRWRSADNDALGDWLKKVRLDLQNQKNIDLRNSPACIVWQSIPQKSKTNFLQRNRAIVDSAHAICDNSNDRVVIIGDSIIEKSRANIAKLLSKRGFKNIEPVTCRRLISAVKDIEAKSGIETVYSILNFCADCMTGANKGPIKNSIISHHKGKKAGAKLYGEIVKHALKYDISGNLKNLLAFIRAIKLQDGIYIYRSELFSSMEASLELSIQSGVGLSDSAWTIQNTRRHAGRKIGRRSLGSTLLVKGLEFEKIMIIDACTLDTKNLYVALTRATKELRILSSSPILKPHNN